MNEIAEGMICVRASSCGLGIKLMKMELMACTTKTRAPEFVFLRLSGQRVAFVKYLSVILHLKLNFIRNKELKAKKS